ncbi:MAG TPA: hypothetical protein VE685_23490 [Thermoanaerobaculia bacterium]|nr:hypothetical protein [Thermoanaerobaculia bacterium]
MTHRKRSRALLAVLGSAAALMAVATTVAGRQDPAPAQTAPAAPAIPPPPPPSFSGNIPLSVSIPSGVTTPEQARPFFDTFSWQSFVALSWPAAPNGPRGTPDQPNNPAVFLNAAAGGQPVVWGTYKEDFELFDQGNNRPTPWESTTVPVNPCGNTPMSPGQKVFVRYTKGDDVAKIDNEAFSYPLIDQQLNYAVFEVRFNQTQYDFIRGSDNDPKSWLYLVKNLAAREPLQMPASSPPSTQGALMVKASWKVLTPGVDDASRFYAVDSLVYDPTAKTQKCTAQKVGLVGFHIVQKLKDFPEWIWTTFEQVDNVPAAGDSAGKRYSFNNGTNDPQTIGGYANRPPTMAPNLQPKDQRKPVQVTRLNPIPDSTAALNKTWQQALNKTVWQYYQLVFTQWPTQPQSFKTLEAGGIYPQDSGGAFPVNGVTNTVMETYFQSQSDAAGAGGNSCMSCHYQAGQADYSWTLLRGAH